MKISNKIKAVLLSQYIGQNIFCYAKNSGENIPYRNNLLQGVTDGHVWINGSGASLKYNDFKLLLKPMSAITDKDYIEIAKIAYNKNNYTGDLKKFISIPKSGKDCLESNIMGCSFTKLHISFYIYQFLQSKGYDIPQYLLGGKTLLEAKLAIY